MNTYPVYIAVGYVIRVTGKSKRSAQRLLFKIAKKFEKNIKWVTIKEFCLYMNLQFAEIEHHFIEPLKKRER